MIYGAKARPTKTTTANQVRATLEVSNRENEMECQHQLVKMHL